jgi:tRNA modification GTPase
MLQALVSADTICALATPNGVGAIALIRVSGREAFNVVSSCFSKTLHNRPSHTAHFGYFKAQDGSVIDEVLITIFETGKSFTGEESVEITCHASPYIQQEILRTLVHAGCRMAEPGEFTLRAFLNGKLDLSQAEAVADLIASQSANAHRIALNQLRGGFSSELNDLREKLIHFASLIELELDFAEEDVEFADRTQLFTLVDEVLQYVNRLAHSFELGNAIKHGVPVAIVGAPNTGKSTLLNRLLGEERAIVSNIAGTTRDVIEETLNIDGIVFRLIDTAGIREGAEAIEAIGIERSKEKIKQATIVLCMADISENQALEDVLNWAESLRREEPGKHIIVVGNKADKVQTPVHSGVLAISAKANMGIEDLKSDLVKRVLGDFNLANDTIVSSMRHYEALIRTAAALEQAKQNMQQGVTGDFVAMDIRQAMYELGSITGAISTEDLLGNIFSKFCIGK